MLTSRKEEDREESELPGKIQASEEFSSVAELWELIAC
jgi:hypothetical protein